MVEGQTKAILLKQFWERFVLCYLVLVSCLVSGVLYVDLSLISLVWNPGQPQLLAVCFSGGSISVLQLSSQLTVVASLPSTTEACSSNYTVCAVLI